MEEIDFFVQCKNIGGNVELKGIAEQFLRA